MDSNIPNIPNITLRSELHAPFNLEAIVIEEDTAMVLSADSSVSIHDEHPIRLMTTLIDQKPEQPGSIVIRGKSPYRLYAIVHDFEQTPSFQSEWVTSAIDNALLKCSELEIANLAMQTLGSTYGRQSAPEFMDLLTIHIRELDITLPKNILILD